ncbi:MAG: TolC family protein [Myxococcales bacterium]|nr:TolC family protein [Myxococcales bacterium]MDH3486019.1 TolC family protein [Myxococcales bacterium]
MNAVCKWNGRASTVVVVLAATFAPAAAAAEVVTLEELEELALQNQARWEAVDARSARTAAEVDAARAGKMPTFWLDVTGVAAPGSDIERVQTVDGRDVNVRASPTFRERTAFRPNIRYDGTVGMRAPLYDGQTRAAVEAAEAYRASAQASSGASRHAIVALVRVSYLDWLANHLVYGHAATSAQEAKAQRERIAARVADGDRPGSELDAARYEELQAELVATEALAQAVVAKRHLEAAVGIELSPGAEPDGELLQIESQDASTDARLEIAALERQRDAARQEARMHRKSRAPVLAVIGQTGVAGVNDSVFPMYRLGLQLAVPLWDGGRAAAMAHAADAQAAELEARARDTEVSLNGEQQRAILDRKHAEEQLALADELVAVSEKRIGQTQASYDLGAGNLEAVADARAAHRQAQSRRVQIQVARADAVLRLGGLD